MSSITEYIGRWKVSVEARYAPEKSVKYVGLVELV